MRGRVRDLVEQRLPSRIEARAISRPGAMHFAAPTQDYRGRMLRSLVGLGCVVFVACEPTPGTLNGAGLLINVAPANRPALVGAIGFDLLDAGAGEACVDRYSPRQYWLAVGGIERMSSDPLTQQAIAAAVTDAISRLDDVDSILVTRVVTESKSHDRICAKIIGRGIRLTKRDSPPPRDNDAVAPRNGSADDGGSD